MLRVLALSWLVGGLCWAANAQVLSLSQDAANNYAMIAPGDVSSDIRLRQSGQDNMSEVQQDGQDNSMYVRQKGRNNTSEIVQYGNENIAVVSQQGAFWRTGGSQTSYVGQQTSYGYLSQFNSGGVSILALTGSGNTLISSFGRSH
jgi:hypothetical protein